MIRCLHLADLHLGWTPQFLGDNRTGIRQKERDALLQKAVDYALNPASRIDLVLIAGDLFESHRPDPSLVEEVLRQLGRLERAGILVVTVPGNHDEISYHDSVYRLRGDSWPGLLVRNPMPELVRSADIRGVRVHIYSLAYTGGLTRVSELEDLPRASEPGLHVGVFHGSLDWNTGDRSLPIRSQALERAGYDYVALGHIHQHHETRVGKGAAVYPGAIEYKGFADPGVGYFTVAQLDGGRITIETPKAEVRKHVAHDVDVSAARSRNELVQSCCRLSDPEALVRITLKGAPPFTIDPEALKAALQEQFFHVEVEDETDVLGADLVRTYDSEPTIRGCFVRRMARRIDAATTDSERRLLQLALRKGVAAFERGGEGR
ncbi:MAG: DNA repair exonuclease [Bacillota bacterium]